MTERNNVPFDETQAWTNLVATDITLAEKAHLRILGRIVDGAPFTDPDPITRLYNAMMSRGDGATTHMLKAYVKVFGKRVVSPAIIRMLDQRDAVQQTTAPAPEPEAPAKKPKVKANAKTKPKPPKAPVEQVPAPKAHTCRDFAEVAAVMAKRSSAPEVSVTA